MSIRLVIDMNLPPEWAAAFQSEGISADHWSAVGDIRADDATIMDWARTHQAVVLTSDLDFTTILALTHSIGPSVIVLRARNLLSGSLRTLVRNAIDGHRAELEAGALIVLEAWRSAIRILPL